VTAPSGETPRRSHLDVFDEHRGLVFSIAYRMLGSATEAEDAVQEAFVRYVGALAR
jgi:RNA polymerase sigma-70 factor (ECF subfamily)